MLISRVSSKAYSESSSSQSSVLSTASSNTVINDRKGSLNYLWANFQKSIGWYFEEHGFVTDFNCDVLDSTEQHWIPASGKIRSDGTLRLREASENERILNNVSLVQATVIGHLGQDLVQVFAVASTFLLKCRRGELGQVCASLFAYSQLRPSGIENKLWFPPPGKILYSNPILLSTNVKAYFTPYNPHMTSPWASFGASLSETGELQLVNHDNVVVYSLQIQNVLGSRINVVDPSLVGSHLVLLLFPDMGGPETAYIKFSDRYEFEEWVATLRALSLQPVAAPISHEPAESIRWSRTLTVKIGYCESTSPSSNENVMQHSGSGLDSKKYVEICLHRWRTARTCIDFSHGDCNWNETFVFSGPESTIKQPDQMELKLRKMVSNLDGPSENDETIGSVMLTVDSQSRQGEWYEFKPSNHRINITVEQTDIPVLDTMYYSKLYDWVSDLNIKLAMRLVYYNSMSMPSLFPIFDKAYRAQGRQLEWIFDMITAEVPNLTTHGDTLFRENSMLTKAIESLLHQQGADILKRTVGRFIRKLVEVTHIALELDPKKVNNEDVLTRNIDSMSIFLNLLWSFIRHEKIPPLCRPVFRHFKREFENMGLQGTALTNVMFRTLAAFLFLRFYVPALINPQNYNLTNVVLSTGHRRSLVLVAKILQAFANRVQFGKKEQWLAPMNAFIKKNGEDLDRWYESILSDPSPATSPTKFLGIESVGDTSTSSSYDDDLERPPKQVPVNTFMGMQLASPSLIDEPAVYSQFANYISNEFEPSLAESSRKEVEKDSLISSVIKESKRIVNRQNGIIAALDKPDDIRNCGKEHEPKIHLNPETLLFGLNREQLEPEVARESSTAGSEQKPSSSREKYEEKGKSISVKKITQMLRIGKS